MGYVYTGILMRSNIPLKWKDITKCWIPVEYISISDFTSAFIAQYKVCTVKETHSWHFPASGPNYHESHLCHHWFQWIWWRIKSVWVQYVCLCMLELAVLGHWRHTCASLSFICHAAKPSSHSTGRLMPVLQLLCIVTQAFSTLEPSHCTAPPPLPILLNSIPTIITTTTTIMTIIMEALPIKLYLNR